jgi:hypothetical protein
VSQKDLELKDLEKRVRSLTTLTVRKIVPTCLVVPFNAAHPLPEVLIFLTQRYTLHSCFYFVLLSLFVIPCFCIAIGSSFTGSRPPLPEEGPIITEIAPSDPEAPKTTKNQGRVGVEGSLEVSDSTQSPPPAESEELCADRKRKHQEDCTSLGTSKLKDVQHDQSTSKNPPASLFDFLEADL